ncbi:MAG: hypothetical protein LAN70_05695 [Acidobacteriia bacterium]|nr:hypothetical protein [Terriglobia bacterium]
MIIITHRVLIWFPDIGAIHAWDQFGTSRDRLQGFRHRRWEKESKETGFRLDASHQSPVASLQAENPGDRRLATGDSCLQAEAC